MKNQTSNNLRAALACSGLLLGLALVAACAEDDHSGHAHEPVGKASGADCPDGSSLTYATFGQKFMADYCLRCHSSEVEGAARMKAPADHNFDSLAEIELYAEHIDQMAAAGPDNTNATMPPIEPKPTEEEREKLGEWLACGAQ